MNNTIKFFDNMYVGFVKDIGFMVPDGIDQAAIKRKATVDSWAQPSTRAEYDPVLKGVVLSKNDTYRAAVTIPNEPVAGFTLGERVNRGGSYSGSQDKWKITDPRGFILEIRAGNLQQILYDTTVINGVIQEQCVWAREGAINVLIPLSSSLYKTAKENTERMTTSVTPGKLNQGDICLMSDGSKKIFLGKFKYDWVKTETTQTSSYPLKYEKTIIHTTSQHYFMYDEDASFYPYNIIGKPKVSKVIGNEPIDPKILNFDKILKDYKEAIALYNEKKGPYAWSPFRGNVNADVYTIKRIYS